MSWRKYSNYNRRRIRFRHEGHTIEAVFTLRMFVYSPRRLEVSWVYSGSKGVRFYFEFQLNRNKPNWREVFTKFRTSLAYGMNPASRPVTDKLMGIKPDQQHPIHMMYYTSSALK